MVTIDTVPKADIRGRLTNAQGLEAQGKTHVVHLTQGDVFDGPDGRRVKVRGKELQEGFSVIYAEVSNQ